MLFFDVNLRLDRASSPTRPPSLLALFQCLVRYLLATALSLVRSRLSRPRPRWPRRRHGLCRISDDLVPFVLELWTPSTIDPLEAYEERARYYTACARVHSSWTVPALTELQRDLLIARANHPVLACTFAYKCPLDLSRVERISYAPRPRYGVSPFRLLTALRFVLNNTCETLTSLALIDVESVELEDLCRAPNLVELVVHNLRISRPPQDAEPEFALPHLEKLTLSEICFRHYRPAYAAILSPEALPSLVSLSLLHCDLTWTLLPEDRTFPELKHLNYTRNSPVPITHLSQFLLPVLTHLQVCPAFLRALVHPGTATHSTTRAAVALLAQVPNVRITEEHDARPPPARDWPPLPRVTKKRSIEVPTQANGTGTFGVPFPLRVPYTDVVGLEVTLLWASCPPGTLVAATQAQADLATSIHAALFEGALFPEGGTLTLPFAMRHGLPCEDARTWGTNRRARASLFKICSEVGVELRYAEAGVEEVERLRAGWAGWGGCIPSEPDAPYF